MTISSDTTDNTDKTAATPLRMISTAIDETRLLATWNARMQVRVAALPVRAKRNDDRFHYKRTFATFSRDLTSTAFEVPGVDPAFPRTIGLLQPNFKPPTCSVCLLAI